MRLTTKEISRQAGCAEGTLFLHFKSKEELSLAVVLENAPKFREEIAQSRVGQRTVAKNLEDIAMAATSFFDKLIPLATSLLADRDLLKRHRKVMAEERRGPQDVFALVAAYIGGEQQLHRIGDQVKPESTAALLLGPCFQRVFMRHVMGQNPLGLTDREFVAALVENLILSLRQTGGPDAEQTS